MSKIVKNKIYENVYLNGVSAKVYSNSKIGQIARKISKAFGSVTKIKIKVDEKEQVRSIKKSELNRVFRCSIHNKNPWLNISDLKKAMKSGKYRYNISFTENVKKAELKIYEKILLDMFTSLSDVSDDKDFNEFASNLMILLMENIPNISNLQEALVNQVKSNPECIVHLNLMLSHIHRNPRISNEVKSFAKEISKGILSLHSEEINRLIPSHMNRDPIRSPTEVLIDLLAFLKDVGNEEYHGVAKEAKSIFLKHMTSIENVEGFLNSISGRFPDSELAKKSEGLKNGLMKYPIYTRLHENIYGRAFDSAFVAELVNTPPPEVVKAMTEMSLAFANYLEELSLKGSRKKTISKEIKNVLIKEDPRFWFPAIAELNHLPKEKDFLQSLIHYLQSEKKTGYECISVPYLISKISPILRQNLIYPPWSRQGDINYVKELQPHTKKVRITRKGDPLMTEGGGITLHFQPSIAKKEGLVLSQRPSTVRKPDLDWNNLSKKEKISLKKQLEYGIPWASGMSGTTNICMYAWNYFSKKRHIDLEPAILGFIMFLVYDGGHSIHEPIWALTQINKKLKLKLELNTTPKLEDFISDYEEFTNLFEGELKSQVNSAFDKSFDQVVGYFKDHSTYAKNQEV